MTKYSYKGLSDREVLESRETYGSNEIPPPEIETFWDKLIDNFKVCLSFFKNQFLYILLVMTYFFL